MIKRCIVFSACALLYAGCGSQNGQSAAKPARAPAALANPLDFPLYPNAALVSTHAFRQKVVVVNGQTGTSVFANGSGTYSGDEVIASSGATFGNLSAWVDRFSAAPPAGYAQVEDGRDPAERTQAQQYGLDYAVFQKRAGAHTRGVLVIVMDPQRVNQRWGKILGMIAKYRALPEIMRAPIDSEAKARIGMTITQATQPESPIGAALAALDQFEHNNARGIVVLDAVKR